MTSELHVSFTIPAEYVRGAKQDVILDMPISYAQGLAKVIGDGCQRALTEDVGSRGQFRVPPEFLEQHV